MGGSQGAAELAAAAAAAALSQRAAPQAEVAQLAQGLQAAGQVLSWRQAWKGGEARGGWCVRRGGGGGMPGHA
jgi:hypothetical protein